MIVATESQAVLACYAGHSVLWGHEAEAYARHSIRMADAIKREFTPPTGFKWNRQRHMLQHESSGGWILFWCVQPPNLLLIRGETFTALNNAAHAIRLAKERYRPRPAFIAKHLH